MVRDLWYVFASLYIEWMDNILHSDGTDACVVPVLEKEEAGSHHHNKARNSFLPSGDLIR